MPLALRDPACEQSQGGDAGGERQWPEVRDAREQARQAEGGGEPGGRKHETDGEREGAARPECEMDRILHLAPCLGRRA